MSVCAPAARRPAAAPPRARLGPPFPRGPRARFGAGGHLAPQGSPKPSLGSAGTCLGPFAFCGSFGGRSVYTFSSSAPASPPAAGRPRRFLLHHGEEGRPPHLCLCLVNAASIFFFWLDGPPSSPPASSSGAPPGASSCVVSRPWREAPVPWAGGPRPPRGEC